MNNKSFSAVFNNIGLQIQTSNFYSSKLNKTIYAERDIGGWNNIRMGAEVSVCLACKYRRSFIPPERMNWYLVENKGEPVTLFDYFDEASFRSVIPVVNEQIDDVYLVQENDAFDDIDGHQNWKFNSQHRLFSQYFDKFPEYTRLVHSAFRIRADLLEETSDRLKYYGLEDFVAMHFRKGDFNFNEYMKNSQNDVENHLRENIQGKVVLIISDEIDESMIHTIDQYAKRVVCWSNINASSYSDMVIDMLCCVPAQQFYGTPLSTLSTGIMQWRNRVGTHSSIEYIHQFSIDDFPYFYGTFPGWGKTDIPGQSLNQ